jgi:hypothetical protein
LLEHGVVCEMAKVAYLVLSHGLPYQTVDFLWSVWRPEDTYFVHVDRKSPAVAAAAIAAIAAAYPNIHVVPSEICTWGGFSLVEATLRCLAAALAADEQWSHAVVVSSTHFPLRPAAALAAALEPEACYLTFHSLDLAAANSEPQNWWSGVMRRLIYEHLEVPGLGLMRGPAKSQPRDVTFYWGQQWWILSRSAGEFVCRLRQGSLAEYLRTSAVPDESYFQTILANSPFKQQMKHKQIMWQQWDQQGRPRILSDKDIRIALTSQQFFARKASEATMREENGVVAKKIASIDRASWVESVTHAFADFLSPSMFSILNEGYRQGGSQPEATSPEEDIPTRSLLNAKSQMITQSAAKYGLEAQISSSVSASTTATLSCRFPGSRTHATYLLILRFCNREIAWVGLYLKSADLDKAAADLNAFPDRQLIDFDFPIAGGLSAHRDLLEFGVRRKGVVYLNQPRAAENLEAVTREYLEILSRIPGMISRD